MIVERIAFVALVSLFVVSLLGVVGTIPFKIGLFGQVLIAIVTVLALRRRHD